jgi:hypothetical protein
VILSLEHTQFPWLVEWQLLLDAVPLRRRQLLESAKRVTKYGKVPQTAVTWAKSAGITLKKSNELQQTTA